VDWLVFVFPEYFWGQHTAQGAQGARQFAKLPNQKDMLVVVKTTNKCAKIK
jgi:hypothetical protein